MLVGVEVQAGWGEEFLGFLPAEALVMGYMAIEQSTERYKVSATCAVNGNAVLASA